MRRFLDAVLLARAEEQAHESIRVRGAPEPAKAEMRRGRAGHLARLSRLGDTAERLADRAAKASQRTEREAQTLASVQALVEEGLTATDIAERLGLSPGYVQRLRRQMRESGLAEALCQREPGRCVACGEQLAETHPPRVKCDAPDCHRAYQRLWRRDARRRGAT